MKKKFAQLRDLYAHGGEAITSKSRFMKAPTPFRDDNEPTAYKKVGKGGAMSKMTGETKTRPAPLPKGARK